MLATLQPYIIKVEHLSKSFSSKKKTRIIDDVSFSIEENRSFGLLGKTGSGKTTIGLCILRLLEPDSGHVFYRNIDITGIKFRDLRKTRKDLQIIFQDPDTSLNPVYSIRETLSEVLLYHGIIQKDKAEHRIDEILEQVGISPNDKFKYPHEFSTGQKQRICIARSLAIHPKFVVLDEITSSLDTFNQNKIIDLLLRLQEKYNLSYLFISHNLNLAKIFCNELAFLKNGKIILQGRNEEVFDEMKNFYF